MSQRVLIVLLLTAGSLSALGPEPGAIYKEFGRVMRSDDWRITDPDAGHEGAQAYLPNPVLRINIDDLNGAVRAEAVLDRWGGHPGTSEKRVRFNGNAWITVPELQTTPAGHQPVCFMSQDNPTVAIPLQHLREGENTLEGTCGDQLCYSFRWGQWGWNAIVVRVYYGPAKPHPRGRVVSPGPGETLGENPLLRAEAKAPGGIERVDFLAHYTGYDEDGDGVFTDWHHSYFYSRRVEPVPGDPRIRNHAGTARRAPYEVKWNTRWVPDQPGGRLKVLARILGKDGVWFVTEPVEKLSLARKESSVQLYKPYDVPERHWVRDGRRSSSKVRIPSDHDLAKATEASIHVRTWNGIDEKLTVNDWAGAIAGGNHVYTYSVRPVPISSLKQGENVIGFHSTTEHHGVEILWPGPALIVRYSK